jgi:peptidoglycan/LPS O-acetylase OafA/YrhL
MSEERHRHEKEEKQEKEEEKHEKSWEEKWRRDPLNVITWALVLAWGGVVLILESQGAGPRMWGDEGWAAFFTGAGVLLLGSTLLRLLVPALRGRLMGGLILGLIFLAIGLGGLIGWGSWMWGVVLIVIAIVMLLGGITRRRRTQ